MIFRVIFFRLLRLLKIFYNLSLIQDLISWREGILPEDFTFPFIAEPGVLTILYSEIFSQKLWIVHLKQSHWITVILNRRWEKFVKKIENSYNCFFYIFMLQMLKLPCSLWSLEITIKSGYFDPRPSIAFKERSIFIKRANESFPFL